MTGPARPRADRNASPLANPDRLIVVALALLALAWTCAPLGRTPPLYDGLGFPDQPYRYVQAPAGYQHTSAPSAATRDITIRAGGSSTFDVASAELGPQVEVFVNQESLRFPGRTTVVHLRATPTATTTQPSDGEVWGNVYRLSADTDTGAGTIAAGGRLDSIRLRAPTGPPPTARIEFRDATGWHDLTTSKIGNDIYSAPLRGVGDYAVIAPKGQAHAPRQTTTAAAASTGESDDETTTDASAPSSAFARPLLVILGVALLALVGVIAAIRFRRRGDADPSQNLP